MGVQAVRHEQGTAGLNRAQALLCTYLCVCCDIHMPLVLYNIMSRYNWQIKNHGGGEIIVKYN